MSETWIIIRSSNSDSSPTNNPVVDPFAIVTDHHKQGKNNGTQSRSISTKESVAATVNDVAIHMADSEGEHSIIPCQSKCVTCSADTVHAATHRDSGGVEAASGFNTNTT